MNHNIQHIIQLLKKYLEREEHPDNNQELKQLFDQYPELHQRVQKLEDPKHLEQSLMDYAGFQDTATKASKQRVLNGIMKQIEVGQKSDYRRVLHKSLFRCAAAAAVVAVLSFGLWKIKSNPPKTEEEITRLAESITPGTERAILRTEDGKVIELKDHSGIVMGEAITYNDGSVLLQQADKNIKLTLSTPKGGQYQITLPDGTKVWLNAASKLSYPKFFSGVQRMVELDGEAYFEVARKEKQPFIVKTSKEQVEVLGTHFNVNSYAEEEISKVALAEGKVSVRLQNDQFKVLNPGQQSVVKAQQVWVEQVNIDEVIAWKNGEFMFNNEALSSAVRQLERWYDIDIEVDPALSKLALWGSVSRLENFDKVLKIIKMTDDNIQVDIAGRRVRLMK